MGKGRLPAEPAGSSPEQPCQIVFVVLDEVRGVRLLLGTPQQIAIAQRVDDPHQATPPGSSFPTSRNTTSALAGEVAETRVPRSRDRFQHPVADPRADGGQAHPEQPGRRRRPDRGGMRSSFMALRHAPDGGVQGTVRGPAPSEGEQVDEVLHHEDGLLIGDGHDPMTTLLLSNPP